MRGKQTDLIRKEVSKCLLCHNAKCSRFCHSADPARIIRALYFLNTDAAADMIKEMPEDEQLEEACAACPGKVDIRSVLSWLLELKPNLEGVSGADNVDLSCDICGVPLENPFVLSSSVVASNYEMCSRAFEMGWAGVCFKTISLIDIHEASPRFSAVRSPSGKWYGFKNIEQLSDHSLEENLECFRRLKEKYPEKVIIASIMGRNEEEWEYLSRKVTEAGADVVECNFSCPNMEAKGTGSDVGQDPETVKRYSEAAKRGTHLPVLAKMTPNITDMRLPARAALEGGADGIAAINTIKSVTGVNIDTLVPQPSVRGRSMLGGYSGPAVKPIALRFISEMAKDDVIKGHHLSGMGGVENWRDALEFILLGAGSIQITTAVMEYGYRIIDDLTLGLRIYMAQRDYRRISEFVGAALDSLVENDEVERDTVVYPVINEELCNGCGRCYISCRDGGHQAVIFHEDTGKVSINGKNCVGCQLCSLVCPARAITGSRRVPLRKG
ncbi:MAG: NAD-dependent dihydropyrimidine dehydrogenase subunit PreA [Lachnospiraceae bacterium]|nr:NAD-dependent dihydropyrimidine dehydrogenase subunit PreA [Lachnospiraceae bacterium]